VAGGDPIVAGGEGEDLVIAGGIGAGCADGAGTDIGGGHAGAGKGGTGGIRNGAGDAGTGLSGKGEHGEEEEGKEEDEEGGGEGTIEAQAGFASHSENHDSLHGDAGRRLGRCAGMGPGRRVNLRFYTDQIKKRRRVWMEEGTGRG
jgi:hypothetical protein